MHAGSSTVVGLREQFSTLWLAATNPKKLTKDAVQHEELSERCQQIVKYLSPFFTFDLDYHQGTEKQQQQPHVLPRVTLYVAVQLLFGLHVLFDKKVSLVQRQLAGLVREVRIHLNLQLHSSSGPGTKNNRNTKRRKEQQNDKKCLNEIDDNIFVSQKRVSEILNGAQQEDLAEYIDKIIAHDEKAGFLDTDSVLETLKYSRDLDDLVHFGDANCKVETLNELLKMSDTECDLDKEKHLDDQKEPHIDFDVPDLDFTPARNDLDLNQNVPLGNMKRSPENTGIDINDIKRKKLEYESLLVDEKLRNKVLKSKPVQIDTPIELSSQTIKNWLTNSKDLVKKEKLHDFILYNKQKLFFENLSEIDNYLKISEEFFKTRFEEIDHRNQKEKLMPEKKISEDILTLRFSNTGADNVQIHSQSRNFSDSSARLRNNSQESGFSEQLGRSRFENSPIYQPPDLDEFEPNIDFGKPNFRSSFNESGIFRNEFPNGGEKILFDEIYQPGSCSKRRAAEGFYQLLRKASRGEININQDKIMGRILIKRATQNFGL